MVICLDLMKRLKGLRLVICDDESSESVPQQYHFASEVCIILFGAFFIEIQRISLAVLGQRLEAVRRSTPVVFQALAET